MNDNEQQVGLAKLKVKNNRIVAMQNIGCLIFLLVPILLIIYLIFR